MIQIDMPTPKNCAECSFYSRYETCCSIASYGCVDRYNYDYNEKPDWCPLEEPKTGKWIPHKSVFGGLGERVYTCDQCGYNIGFHVENFCPGCGSQMTEGLHDSD